MLGDGLPPAQISPTIAHPSAAGIPTSADEGCMIFPALSCTPHNNQCSMILNPPMLYLSTTSYRYCLPGWSMIIGHSFHCLLTFI